MLCNNCGNSNHYKDANYCAECGTRLFYLICCECGGRITGSESDCECSIATDDTQDQPAEYSKKEDNCAALSKENDLDPVDVILSAKMELYGLDKHVRGMLGQRDGADMIWFLERVLVKLNELHRWCEENHYSVEC